MSKRAKKKMKNKTFCLILIPIIAILLAITVVLNIEANIWQTALDYYLGLGERHVVKAEGTENWDTDYYPNPYKDADSPNLKAVEEAAKVSREIGNEGIVLMKNNGVLPLAESAVVSPFGYRYLYPVYSVYGSGCVYGTNGMMELNASGPQATGGMICGSSTQMIFLEDALKSNFKVNAATVEVMNAADKAGKMVKVDAAEGATACQETNPISCTGANTYLYEFPAEIYNSVAAECADTVGLVFIARDAGEGGDLKYDAYADGTPHQLALSQNEKDTIKFVKKNCKKTIVIINSCNTMQLGELTEGELEADAIVWVGYPGTVGFGSLSDILCGKVNPSGRTVDTWASDITQNPVYDNIGDFRYNNVRISDYNGTAATRTAAPFVEYEEGVYVGYKYYETAAVEDDTFDYDKAVVFPFGYGLTYSEFRQEIVSVKENGDEVTVEVEIFNSGTVDGKEIVQLYYTAPYTQKDIELKIEKPVKNLLAFTKVEVGKGASRTATLTFDKEEMASYCYTKDNGDGSIGCYFLEGGEYVLTLGKNSHDEWDSEKINIKEEWFNGTNARQSEKDGQSALDDGGNPLGVPAKVTSDSTAKFVAATNRFEDCNDYMNSGKVTNLSRANWKGTKPTAPTSADFSAAESVVSVLSLYDYTTYNPNEDELYGDMEGSLVYTEEKPVSKQDNGLSAIDMRGKSYYDETWDLLLDQIDYDNSEELLALLFAGSGNISGLKEVGLFNMSSMEGPSGIGSFSKLSGGQETMAYCSGMALASTWNTELARKVGESIAREMLNYKRSEGNVVNGWTGPAMNLHRSPFGGRNGEYYSEDATLAGLIGVQVVDGATENGLYCIFKHFAMNDQETNRHGVATWATEQTIRETYLKTFELVFKRSRVKINYISDEQGTLSSKVIKGATAVMTSMNRIGGMPAGSHYGLLNEVLRNEWGFCGFTQTDQPIQTSRDLLLRCGGDIEMGAATIKPKWGYDSAIMQNCMRNSVHNILYAVVNTSNAMNGIAPGTTVYYDMAPWRIALVAANCVLVALIAAGAVWVAVRCIKNRPVKRKDEGEGNE